MPTKKRTKKKATKKKVARKKAAPKKKVAKKAPASSSSGGITGTHKLAALLSYFLIGIIWYLVDENMKKSSFVKFHAMQGLAFIIVSIVLRILVSILIFFDGFIGSLVDLALLVLLIFGIVYSLQGKSKALPVIGGLAKNFNF